MQERVERIVQTMQWLKAYPCGEDDASKTRTVQNAEAFLSTSPADDLLQLIGTCIEAGKLPNRELAAKHLTAIISHLRSLPADRHREAMLEQGLLALRELENSQEGR